MYKILDILGEAYQVNLRTKESIPLQDGVIDEAYLSTRKKAVLSFGMHYLREDFVGVEKKFPANNEVEVDLELDFVVLKGEDYRRLMKLIDKYGEL